MDTSADALIQNKTPLLKTADQYQAWRVRIANKCWAATGKDIFALKDQVCVAAIKAVMEEKDASKRDNWVGTCWLTITGALHDDLLVKVAHVERGMIGSLLAEINAALVVYSAEEIQPLRLELYGATMQKEGNSDLQTYYAYLEQRRRKLAFLQRPVEDAEMMSIFLKGLHPIFQPLQVHFAIPNTMPATFEALVEVVRKFSATPAMAAELAKLKSGGVSQHMFPATTTQPQKALCRLFARSGTCRYGANCKFLHTSTPREPLGTTGAQTQIQFNKAQVKCAFCYSKGHTAVECRKRLSQLAAIPATSTTLVAQDEKQSVATPEANDTQTQTEAPFSFVLTISADHNISNWVMDSGATASATFDEADCTNIRDCDIKITAAGSVFSVKRIGTATIQALDDKGRVQKLSISNCLISPLFPYKLLSLQAFTKKGHVVLID